MAQIFQITDGTTTIDLLDSASNYHLASWDSSINQWKDGGIYTNNPSVDGSIPISKVLDTVEEKLKIHITGTSQDSVISSLRSLFTTLDAAILHFTDRNNVPVYFVVKADAETNTRYGLITGYKLESIPPQFDGPFMTGGFQNNTNFTAIYADIDIVITRREWTKLAPGSSERALIGNNVTFNAVGLGVSSTSSAALFVVPKYTVSNLSHIYRYDASITTYSSNLLAAALPYQLLPTSPAVGDILYLGTQTSITDSGPFSNVIFNLSQATVSTIVGVWEYYNGSWVTLTVQDNTKANGDSTGTTFDTTGVKSVSFIPPSGWTTVAINGVTGYWIRYRLTSVSGTTLPMQQTRHPYSATVPYIDAAATDISGDADALSKIRITDQTKGTSVTNISESIIIGRRLYSRGSNFNAYINLSDEQNQSGITVTGTFANDLAAPSGRAATKTLSASSLWDSAFTVAFDSTVASHYYGRFRVMLALNKLAGGADTRVRLSNVYGAYNCFNKQGWVTYNASVSMQVVDLGFITLPINKLLNNSESHNGFTIGIEIYLNSTDTVRFYQLMLVPVDESAVQIVYNTDYSGRIAGQLSDPRYVEIDNLTNIGQTSSAIIRRTSNSAVIGAYRLIGGGGLKLSRDRARYWFFPAGSISLNSSSLHNVLEIILSKNDRYLLPRGSI